MKSEPRPGAKLKCPKCQKVFAAESPVDEVEEYLDEEDELPPAPPSRSAPPRTMGGSRSRPVPAKKGKKAGSSGLPVVLILSIAGGVLLIAGLGIGGFLWWRSSGGGLFSGGSGIPGAAGAASPQEVLDISQKAYLEYDFLKEMSLYLPESQLQRKAQYICSVGQWPMIPNKITLQEAFAKRNAPFERIAPYKTPTNPDKILPVIKEKDFPPEAYQAMDDFMRVHVPAMSGERKSGQTKYEEIKMEGDRASAEWSASEGGRSFKGTVRFERHAGRWYFADPK